MSDAAAPTIEIARIAEPDAGLGDALVALQKRVWGSEPEDVMPSWRFVVAPRTGGELLIARAGADLVGFALCSPGLDGHAPYLYLDLLGVHPDQRHARIGERLMHALSRAAAQRGLDRIRWTFDPLEGANANLYLAKLGARGIRFWPDLYGSMARAGQQGERSDRLLAELRIRPDGTTPGGRPRAGAPILAPNDALAVLSAVLPTVTPTVPLDVPLNVPPAFAPPARLALALPTHYAHLRRTDPATARLVRAQVGTHLAHLFAAGFEATGFERGAQHNLLILELP